MPSFKNYCYKPLNAEDEIRLIMLNPALNRDTPLKCSLVQHRRSVQKTDYFAISYAWGEPKFSRSLEIRSDGGVSCLKITPIVDDLLRHFRKHKLRGYLWIDAICLDQTNEVEKAHQIPEMGRIFREAEEVLIWLGPGDSQIPELFNFFRTINSRDDLQELESIKASPDAAPALLGVYRLFDDFSKRAWFSRRWVIQEALLAQKATVYCGNHFIPLAVLTLAATHLHSLYSSSYPIKVMASLDTPRSKYTILELLWTFDKALCLEPKDRVAALYGLSHNKYGYQLDYTVHWTEMYKQIALSVLRNGDNDAKLQLLLHLFEFGPVYPLYGANYPPWVPDWSSHRRRDFPYHSLNNSNALEPYPISPGYHAKATLKLRDDFLQVHWNPSINGAQGWQVTYTTIFISRIRCNDQEIRSILLGLFPPSSNSALPILAFSTLFEKVMQLKGVRNDKCCRVQNYGRSPSYQSIVRPRLSESLNKRISKIFRKRYEPRGFYIFKMKPIKSTCELHVGYGMSSQLIQPGDIMIPLWKLDWDREAQTHQLEGYPLHTTTMLVVRRTTGSSLRDSVDASIDEKPTATGRLVGWAVCILLKYDSSINDFRTDATWGTDLDKKQCSMRLL